MSDITREQQFRCIQFGALLGVFFASVSWIAFDDFVANKSLRHSWEAEAVKHGAATWSVDENGDRVFRWKEQPNHE